MWCQNNKKNSCETFAEKELKVNDGGVNPNVNIFLKKSKLPKDLTVTSPESASKILRNMGDLDRENVHVIHLNTKNKVVGIEKISTGTLNASLIHPREVFKGAILNNANAIIVAHNHPSGESKLSEEDRKVAQILKDSGELLNIKVLDFLAITKTGHSSVNNTEE